MEVSKPSKRWADISSDSDDSVPFFRKAANVAAGLNRPDDDSYRLPPLKDDLDDSKTGINKLFRSAVSTDAQKKDDVKRTIVEQEEEQRDSSMRGPPPIVAEERDSSMRGPRVAEERDSSMRGIPASVEGGENVNGAQVGNHPVDFTSFNATWKPNPDAVEFQPLPTGVSGDAFFSSLGCVQSDSTTVPSSEDIPSIQKKRARRVINAGREMASVNGNHPGNAPGNARRKNTASSSTSLADNDSVAGSVNSMKQLRKRTKRDSTVSIGSDMEITPEVMEQRIKMRQKDVTRWKNTEDYNSYLDQIPKDRRRPDDPATPDPTMSSISKRQWKFNNEQWQRRIKDRVKFEKEFPRL